MSIWLPEFDLYSDGESFDAASWGLVEEALEYVREWEIDLRFAPNHARREGWVRRLELAAVPERAYGVLFGGVKRLPTKADHESSSWTMVGSPTATRTTSDSARP